MNLNFIAPINQLSLGLWATALLKSWMKSGHTVSLFPIGGGDIEPENIRYRDVAIRNQDAYTKTGPSVRLFHPKWMAEHVGRGKHTGVTIFELDSLTKREQHHLRNQDELLVPSRWAQQICSSHFIKSRVVPLGVDTTQFYVAKLPRKSNTTVFLNVGKWEIRKGHDVLVEAFERAFSPSDNVRLNLVPHNFFLTDEERRAFERPYWESPLASKIFLIPRSDELSTIAGAMQYADCGVFPFRSEGWCLPALEMMACGKPVIMTNCTGATEYATAGNALLIEPGPLEPAYDNKWFFGEGSWCSFGEAQIEQLVEHMRLIHQQKQEHGPLPVNEAGIETARRFSWQNAADQILAIAA